MGQVYHVGDFVRVLKTGYVGEVEKFDRPYFVVNGSHYWEYELHSATEEEYMEFTPGTPTALYGNVADLSRITGRTFNVTHSVLGALRCYESLMHGRVLIPPENIEEIMTNSGQYRMPTKDEIGRIGDLLNEGLIEIVEVDQSIQADGPTPRRNENMDQLGDMLERALGGDLQGLVENLLKRLV